MRRVFGLLVVLGLLMGGLVTIAVASEGGEYVEMPPITDV